MKLNIACFNLRTQTSADGDNQFILRAPFILEKLNEYRPDIVGFQECTADMRLILSRGLNDYYLVGSGRSETRLGESSPVAFLKERFFLNDLKTFWLSPTPDVPGSVYSGDQSHNPRVVTCASLTEAATGETFRVYNLHADHIGQNARFMAFRYLSALLRADAGKDGLPFILMGDLNAQPESSEIRELLSLKNPSLHDASKDVGATFHNYGRVIQDVNYLKRIDYILLPDAVRASACGLWTDQKDGLYLSDHYPIYARVTL